MSSSLEELVQEQFSRCKFHIPDKQWTVLAGIALRRSKDGPFEVVAIGAGLKCLPLAEYNDPVLNEALVHDCHGEILARRAFICYLLDQMSKHDSRLGEASIYEKVKEKFRIKPSVTFHMYVSHAPCGDASMTNIAATNTNEEHTARKRAKYDDTSTIRRGREDFSAEPGTARTKPGRLDAPFSACMSCSDKICSWTVLGMQGALLMSVLEDPVYLKSISVGDGFDRTSLERALNTRICPQALPAPFAVNQIEIVEASAPFNHRKTAERVSCPESHIWFDGCVKAETLVRGRKKGSGPPKNNAIQVKSSSFASKQSIFLQLNNMRADLSSYSDGKKAQTAYRHSKSKLLEAPCFRGWFRDPFFK